MRFIMKQSMIYYCPPLFLLAKAVGCITINRKAREEAITALRRAAGQIKDSHRSVSVFTSAHLPGNCKELKPGF
jgi:1-acyl-sn-glycerol-3-phosphate acyltransferase